METLSRNIIKAVDLHLGFDKKNVITPEALHFSIEEGAFTALLGTNGAGKTTLLNAILGEPVIQGGGIYLCDKQKPTHLLSAAEISRLISYVPQEHLYPGHLTVFSLLCVVTSFEEQITEVMSELGILELKARNLTSLSSGQRQRVFLARALLQNAPVLLLDEPTNHLDPEGKESFWKALSGDPKNRKRNIFVSTHDLDYVKRFCSHVLALKSGKIIFAGETFDFFKPENMANAFNL